MRDPVPAAAQLPEAAARRQAEWLRPARSRLLRLVDLRRCGTILDAGCGWEFVSAELIERTRARVVGLDHTLPDAQRSMLADEARGQRIQADVRAIPCPDATFDLVFLQQVCLWLQPLDEALDECLRVTRPDGALALVEPDFGGLMEFPESTACRPLWLNALRRAGGEPLAGRKAAAYLRSRGLQVDVLFPDRLEEASPLRFDLLEPLLESEERDELTRIRDAVEVGDVLAHLPYWMIVARRR